ncbi:hypothetical protein DASB73_025560 [Starmerella bacillaris]|uniref:Stress-associated endoplasmic reticulum protein n=1 Tax=Starmerella bacillaris TaxID=1247836 RepID=A0AAV5RKC0_STABA|nr:hypothetical protein DASB73_025560 [Starmerella bacillaris]
MAKQTPAQKAANRAYHNREQAKKGKKNAKPEAAKVENAEHKAPVKARKSKNTSKVSTGVLLLMIFLIAGGFGIQMLLYYFGKNEFPN